jgi:glutathione S-transferase
MAVELYFFQPLGTNSGRVYLTLLEKGVDFVRHELDGRAFDHFQPDYLAINPKGQVPSLVHDGRAITEGAPTMDYIDDAFEGPPLKPSDPKARWRMRCWAEYIDQDFGPAGMMLNWSNVVRPFMGERSRDEVEALLKRVPTDERRRAWKRAYERVVPEAELAESRRRNEVGAARMEAALATSPWLAGDDYSLADINMFNFFSWMPRFQPDLVNAEKTPHAMAWLDRMEARPAVQQMRAETTGRRTPPQTGAETT